MSILTKKNMILGALVVLLVATSYINFKMFGDSKGEVAEEDNPNNTKLVSQMISLDEVVNGQAKVTSAFFSEYRMERDAVRSENLTLLENTVNSKNSSPEAIAEANSEMIKLVKNRETIRNLEGQIKGKGFRDTVVYFDSSYVNVFLDCETISQQQAVQIQDIIVKETSVDLAHISIGCSGNQ
ncbi:MAG: SpoIIIAH-like family protein [Eubacteriaceae bacterium]|nr:SpoIIIAH-like family protein [Eubacteriaceae bacterium]